MNQNHVNKVLSRAADLVERGWTQDTYARNERGFSCSSYGAEACSWCLTGSLMRAASDLYDEDRAEVYDWALMSWYRSFFNKKDLDFDSCFEDAAVEFNDNPDRTQDAVVASLRQAVAA